MSPDESTRPAGPVRPRVPATAALSTAPRGDALTRRVLGGGADLLRLPGPERISRVGGLPRLESETRIPFELEDHDTAHRLWRRPAFLVSVGAALLGVIALATTLILPVVR